MFSKRTTSPSTGGSSAELARLKRALETCDCVVIGAGAGLSTAAGFVYTGERFDRWFRDFSEKYGFRDMYSGGFYPYETAEEKWAFWSRYIYVNRYMDPPKPVYETLLALVAGKDYFVLTTNVDHCFQKAGFDKKRLFYTQGDYGLWQCSEPCHGKTYDNAETVRQMVLSQGCAIAADGVLTMPPKPAMTVDPALVPRCPVCGKPMAMNLRADDTFVEDDGWHAAAARYQDFLRTRQGQRVLYWELGVGYNTPGIIKVPFWQMTAANPAATYACINRGETAVPDALRDRAICIDADAEEALRAL